MAPDGQAYYFNELTRETSWTKPGPQTATEPGPHPASPQPIDPTTASPQPIDPATALQQIPTTSLPRLQQPPTSQSQPILPSPATVSTAVRRRSSPSSHSSKRHPVQQHRHCGPRCSQCVGGFKVECNEMTLHMLGGLKGAGRLLEGFEGAGRVLEQAVSDVGCGLLAAASTLVDDLSLRGARLGVCAKRSPVLAHVRFRPTEGTEGRLRHTDHEVQLAHPGIVPLGLRFDGVLGKASDQAATYERVGARLTETLLEGQSQTLLVCGAASAGKTYSLFGSPSLLAAPTADSWRHWGILPRTGHHLFALANEAGGLAALLGEGGSVRCSFVEVCSEPRAEPLALALVGP